jgi:hypothetical protein
MFFQTHTQLFEHSNSVCRNVLQLIIDVPIANQRHSADLQDYCSLRSGQTRV